MSKRKIQLNWTLPSCFGLTKNASKFVTKVNICLCLFFLSNSFNEKIQFGIYFFSFLLGSVNYKRHQWYLEYYSNDIIWHSEIWCKWVASELVFQLQFGYISNYRNTYWFNKLKISISKNLTNIDCDCLMKTTLKKLISRLNFYENCKKKRSLFWPLQIFKHKMNTQSNYQIIFDSLIAHPKKVCRREEAKICYVFKLNIVL